MTIKPASALRAQMARYDFNDGKARAMCLRLAVGAEIMAATGWPIDAVLVCEKYPGNNSLFYRLRPSVRGAKLTNYGRYGWHSLKYQWFDGLPRVARALAACFWTQADHADEISFTLPAWKSHKTWDIPRDYFQDDPRALGPKPTWDVPGGPRLPMVDHRRSGWRV